MREVRFPAHEPMLTPSVSTFLPPGGVRPGASLKPGGPDRQDGGRGRRVEPATVPSTGRSSRRRAGGSNRACGPPAWPAAWTMTGGTAEGRSTRPADVVASVRPGGCPRPTGSASAHSRRHTAAGRTPRRPVPAHGSPATTTDERPFEPSFACSLHHPLSAVQLERPPGEHADDGTGPPPASRRSGGADERQPRLRRPALRPAPGSPCQGPSAASGLYTGCAGRRIGRLA